MHGLRETDVDAGARWRVLPHLLHFIGGRPLVGYYIDFDVAMLNKYLRGFLGIQLPNPRIEVSGIYYDRKYGDAPPGTQIDLTFAAILRDLNLPLFNQHDAFTDALMTAMIYLKLRDLKSAASAFLDRGQRLVRRRRSHSRLIEDERAHKNDRPSSEPARRRR